MAFLIDTSVLSELRKPTCDPNVADWMSSIEPDQAHISVLTIGEIRMGIEVKRRTAPKVVSPIERWLLELERNYADRILPISIEVADRWGRIVTNRSLPIAEGLIAATAIEHKLVVVTDNPQAFEGSVATLNPFS
jgi:predicted nucleic acid-binding protein